MYCSVKKLSRVFVCLFVLQWNGNISQEKYEEFGRDQQWEEESFLR